jgi:hypothetical protein
VPSEEARRYLEHLQETVYSYLRIPPPSAEREEGMRIARAVAEGWLNASGSSAPAEETKELLANLEKIGQDPWHTATPTRFEDPVPYALLVGLADSVESAAADLSIPLPPRPLLGTLPTGQVNAMTVLVPGTDEHIVVFESELFVFAAKLSKIVAWALPLEGDADDEHLRFSFDEAKVFKNIEQNREILQRFGELLLAYVVNGRPGAASHYFLPEAYRSLALVIHESMELFVLGHEYGHIIAGHLGKAESRAALLGDDEVDRVAYSWEQELEADRWGLQLMIPAMQSEGHDVSTSFWGADLFFSSVDIVRRAIAVLRTGTEESTSLEYHPPPELRCEFVRQVMTISLPGDEAEDPIGLGKTVEAVVEHLWTLTRPNFQRLWKRGRRPLAGWQ